MFADVNGDGRPDMIRARSSDCPGVTPIGEVYINTGASWQLDSSYVYPPGLEIVHHDCGTDNDFDNGVRLLDVNNDGLDDIVRAVPRLGIRPPGSSSVAAQVWLNNGSDGVTHSWTLAQESDFLVPIAFSTGPGDEGKDLGVRFGDVNGDGLIDLIQRFDNPGEPTVQGVYLNVPGTGWVLQPGWQVPLPTLRHRNGNYDPGTRLADVNGDGLIDLIDAHIDNDSPQPIRVFLGIGGQGSDGMAWREAPDWHFPLYFVSVDDVGSGGDAHTVGKDLGVRLADINGDGLIDVIQGIDQGPLGVTKHVYLNDSGKSWYEDTDWSAALPYAFVFQTSDNAIHDYGIRLVDFDGNGAVDLIASRDINGWSERTRRLSQHSFSNQLELIDNGIGGYTTFSYASALTYDNRSPGAPDGARSHLGLAIPVVTTRTDTDNLISGQQLITSYAYGNGFYHYGRREFRGFRYVRETPPGGRMYYETLHVQDPASDVCPLLGETERLAVKKSSGELYSAIFNTFDRTDQVAPLMHWLSYSDTFLYDFGVSPSIDEMTADGSVKHTSTEYARVFDDNGFVSSTNISYFGDPTNPNDDLYRTVEYINDTTAWQIGIPQHLYACAPAEPATGGHHPQRGPEGAHLFDTWLYYDDLNLGHVASTADLTTIERYYPSGNVAIHLARSPIYGHVVLSTDEEGHQISVDYGITDPTFTFPNRSTILTTGGLSPVTHQWSSDFDPRFGTLIHSTSDDSSQSFARYDSFGRIITAWSSLGTHDLPNTCFQYSFTDSSNAILRFDRETYGQGDSCGLVGMLGTATFYDGLGRHIQTKAETSEGGNASVVSYNAEFDDDGRVRAIKRPFFASEPIYWYTWPDDSLPETIIHYDEIGRQLSVERPGPQVTTSDYTAWTRGDVDSENNRIETDLDAFDRVVSRRFYTKAAIGHSLYSTTRYEYDRLGRLTSLYDNTGAAQLQYQYDSLGRISSSFDRDAGHKYMEYYKNGLLKQSFDDEARNQQLDYDELNRVLHVSRIHNGISLQTVYRYDEAGHGIGSLGHMTSIEDLGSGVRDDFQYDPLGRATQSSRRIDGITYDVTSGLDALNRPQWMRYPDSSQISYLYGDDGRVSAIPGFASSIHRTPDGLMLHLEYGNNVGIDLAYDSITNQMSSVHAAKFSSTSPPLVSTSYGYSPGGHLTSIADLVGSGTQQFQLDDFYRLTAASGSYGTLPYSYDNLGNMTRKDSRSFDYSDPSHPHQSTHTYIDGQLEYSLAYDMTGNVTSVLSSSGSGWSYDYDSAGVIFRAQQVPDGPLLEFIHDPSDGQVTKRTYTRNGTAISTVLISRLFEETGSDAIKYIYLDGQRIAEWHSDGSKFYFVNDQLGGTNVVSAANGATIQRIEYKPYGETSFVESDSFSVTYKYAGGRDDNAVQLIDFGARSYNPILGRFMSTDPLLGHPNDFNDLNPYGYALGNPEEMTDPSGLTVRAEQIATAAAIGLSFIPACSGWCTGAVSGALSGSLTAHENGENPWKGALVGGVTGGVTGYFLDKGISIAIQHIVGDKYGDDIPTMHTTNLGPSPRKPTDYIIVDLVSGVAGGFSSELIVPRALGSKTTGGTSSNYDLLFDGHVLTLFGSGGVIGRWPAWSGEPGYWAPQYQGIVNKGPIPEGYYLAQQSRLQYRPTDAWTVFKSHFELFTAWPGPPWGGGEAAWGNQRVWLDPIRGTKENFPVGRNPYTFTIHGGFVAGSAGCIDLVGGMPDFAKAFKATGRDLVLSVDYWPY